MKGRFVQARSLMPGDIIKRELPARCRVLSVQVHPHTGLATIEYEFLAGPSVYRTDATQLIQLMPKED